MKQKKKTKRPKRKKIEYNKTETDKPSNNTENEIKIEEINEEEINDIIKLNNNENKNCSDTTQLDDNSFTGEKEDKKDIDIKDDEIFYSLYSKYNNNINKKDIKNPNNVLKKENDYLANTFNNIHKYIIN